jgi:hypothetical protein
MFSLSVGDCCLDVVVVVEHLGAASLFKYNATSILLLFLHLQITNKRKLYKAVVLFSDEK